MLNTVLLVILQECNKLMLGLTGSKGETECSKSFNNELNCTVCFTTLQMLQAYDLLFLCSKRKWWL